MPLVGAAIVLVATTVLLVLARARRRATVRALELPNATEQWRALAKLVEEHLGVRPSVAQIVC